jgi:hypothetical protein
MVVYVICTEEGFTCYTATFLLVWTVKGECKKGLKRAIHEEAKIMRKTWKGQANSWRKNHWYCFIEAQCSKNGYRYFLHLI